MGVRKHNPVTPSLRSTVTLDSKGLTKKRPEKSLTEPLKSTGGRNARGRITLRQAVNACLVDVEQVLGAGA